MGVMIVDPPSGWMYGFPRPFNFKPSRLDLPEEEHAREYKQWFRDMGYPEDLIAIGMLNHCRWWTYDVD